MKETGCFIFGWIISWRVVLLAAAIVTEVRHDLDLKSSRRNYDSSKDIALNVRSLRSSKGGCSETEETQRMREKNESVPTRLEEASSKQTHTCNMAKASLWSLIRCHCCLRKKHEGRHCEAVFD